MVEELYTTFYDELLHYCVSMAKDWAAAEDLVQETYMRALTHLEDLQDCSRAQCRAWLYKTAKHLYIDRLRKLSREASSSEEALSLAAIEEDLTRAMVQQLVNRLPDTERALFTMRYFQGYNATELGELFGLPPSTVRARLSSARRHLINLYQETIK